APTRRAMLETAASMLEGVAEPYNRAAIRAHRLLQDIGIPDREALTLVPISAARGAGGYAYANELRQRAGQAPRPLDANGEPVPTDQAAIRRGEGATVNPAHDPNTNW